MAKIAIAKIPLKVLYMAPLNYIKFLTPVTPVTNATLKQTNANYRPNGNGAGTPAVPWDYGQTVSGISRPGAQSYEVGATLYYVIDDRHNVQEVKSKLLPWSPGASLTVVGWGSAEEAYASRAHEALRTNLAQQLAQVVYTGELMSLNTATQLTLDITAYKKPEYPSSATTLNLAKEKVHALASAKFVDASAGESPQAKFRASHKVENGSTQNGLFKSPSGHSYVEVSSSVNVSMLDSIETTADVYLGYDTVEFKYFLYTSIDELGLEDVTAAMDEMNTSLAKAAHAKAQGLPAEPMRIYPPVLNQPYGEPADTHIAEWKKQYEAALADYDKMVVSEEYKTAVDEALAADGKELNDENRAAVDPGTAGTTVWSSLWETLKATGAWVGNTIADWGPVGTIGAYAGLKATNSISKMSPWVTVGLIGLAVLVILK